MRMFYEDGQFSSSIIMDNSRPNVSYIISRVNVIVQEPPRTEQRTEFVAVSARRDAHEIYRNEIASLINS